MAALCATISCPTSWMFHCSIISDRTLTCPVFVEENIRALTLAELLRGAGKGHRHFLCLAARSGMGVGIVIDGQIYIGSHERAGKVGSTVLFQNDHPRTMTDLVSAKGIIRQAVQLLQANRKTSLRRSLLEKGDDLSLADLVAAVDAGDRLIRDLLEQVGKNLGLVAANLAHLFAPEKINPGGGGSLVLPTCTPKHSRDRSGSIHRARFRKKWS